MIRFSGIPQIHYGLAKALERSQEFINWQDTFNNFCIGNKRGELTAYVDVAVNDEDFPRFLEHYDQFSITQIQSNPKALPLSLVDIAADRLKRYRYHPNIVTKGFDEFAKELVKAVYYRFGSPEIIDNEPSPLWNRVIGLLNTLKPEAVMAVEVQFPKTTELPSVVVHNHPNSKN